MITWFEWDPVKAIENLRKHHVSFETGIRVFADIFALTDQDHIEGGERRWRTVGMTDGCCLLLVVHTVRDEDENGSPIEIIRVISARKADRKERRRYEQETRQV